MTHQAHERCSRAAGTIAIAVSVCIGLLGAPLASQVQGPALAVPPPVVHAAGAFSARQLSRPPTMDGGAWIAADVVTGPAPQTMQAPRRGFSLSLADAGEDTGDFERYRLLFRRGSEASVRIDDGFTA